MSTGEKNYFYLLEWSDEVTDIQEQFPLTDLDLAVRLASEAGIRYPRDSVSNFPYVLTCDFMVRTKDGFKARTVKTIRAHWKSWKLSGGIGRGRGLTGK